LPFFADSTLLYAHRTQVYAPNKSTFYIIDDSSHGGIFNSLIGETYRESIFREAGNGNYRFAPETGNGGIFKNPILHPVSGLNDEDAFLVGNPYLSSIDIVEFCRDNASSIYPEFHIWKGTPYSGGTFVSYQVDTSTGEISSASDDSPSPYIAPLQGFSLTYKGTGNVQFDVTKISTVRPAGINSNLRSVQETKEENGIRIQAENDYAVSYALIKYREKASVDFVRGEDVKKLFSPYGYVPEIYSLASDVPVDINFIPSKGISIPLGIKIEQKGEIRLTFTGMDHYAKASKIELIDALENKTIDLSGKSSYTYTFNQQGTGIQNGRFSLRLGSLATALPEVNLSDDLNVYGDSKGIYVVSSVSDPVQQLIVYDLQGRKVYESTADAKYYPLQEGLGHLPLIVQVVTRNRTKTVKLNMN